jgi:lysylphosphatidylglycerol synthetase-like protein (DUF2156 family)
MTTYFAQQKEDNRPRMIEFIRRWGGLTSDALLDPACQLFCIPQVEGVIGHRIEFDCAVVYGDPVCAPGDIPLLVQAFHDFCQTKYKNIIYIAASAKFAQWAIQNVCQALIEYGEEVYLDPHFNPKDRQGTHASLVRRKVRHAQHEEVIVKEYFSPDAKIEHALEQVGAAWLQARRGPQIHISHVYLFTDRIGKRWFYAQQRERIVGVAVINQLQSRQGWHLNHLMFTPDAPHGTPEILVVSVLETLQRENCSFISFGAVPINRLGKIVGLSTLTSWIAQLTYKLAHRIFHLEGHKIFWGKFHPQTQPSYLLLHQSHIGIQEVRSLMRAMNVSFVH